MFLMLVQILIGLKVREFIDLNIDIYGFDKKNRWLSKPNIEFYIHRSFSILILVSNISLITIRWENSILANDIENTRYEILKLKEINLNLTTEKNFLTSLAKTEMSTIQDLNMQNAETRLKIK